MSNHELTISELKAESDTLEYLLSGALGDSEFISENKGNKVLYFFVDAHEVKSYIDPEDPDHLVGFTLLAERFSDDMASYEFELKLRNDQFLHALLFHGKDETGLLPSHLEEVEEEIAFKSQIWLNNKIALLEKAKEEVKRLQSQSTFKELLAATLALPGDSRLSRRLVDFFRGGRAGGNDGASS
jgi:hypothetical protein